jgi:hypothetical protein
MTDSRGEANAASGSQARRKPVMFMELNCFHGNWGRIDSDFPWVDPHPFGAPAQARASKTLTRLVEQGCPHDPTLRK